MDNIVRLGHDRPRPRRAPDVPRSGARILFFTGVRYYRDDLPAPHAIRDHGRHVADSGLALELAAH